MASDTKIPSDKVIPFPTQRRAAATHEAVPVMGFGQSHDSGPSTDESLRLMRAFVGIKNQQLRADLIAMLEGASRRRGPAPARGKE